MEFVIRKILLQVFLILFLIQLLGFIQKDKILLLISHGLNLGIGMMD